MTISLDNIALLTRKLGRDTVPAEDSTIKLTIANLCKLLDAAREQGVEIGRKQVPPRSKIDDMFGGSGFNDAFWQGRGRR